MSMCLMLNFLIPVNGHSTEKPYLIILESDNRIDSQHDLDCIWNGLLNGKITKILQGRQLNGIFN